MVGSRGKTALTAGQNVEVRTLDLTPLVKWMPQEVHVKMGESAKASYIAMREAGKDDVMDVMMQVSADLEKNWKEFDDSFVSAYDVGNYVADYLTKQSGNEGCECSSQIF